MHAHHIIHTEFIKQIADLENTRNVVYVFYRNIRVVSVTSCATRYFFRNSRKIEISWISVFCFLAKQISDTTPVDSHFTHIHVPAINWLMEWKIASLVLCCCHERNFVWTSSQCRRHKCLRYLCMIMRHEFYMTLADVRDDQSAIKLSLINSFTVSKIHAYL